MANQLRPNLGLNLQSIVAGDQPPLNIPQQPNLPPMTPAIPQQGGGFFGQQGMGRYLAGAIGDALLQNAGMQPVFAPAQRDQRRAQLEDVQWSRRQQQERADKQWEWQNKPPADDQFTRALEASGIRPGDPKYADAMKRRVETLLNPMVPMQSTDAQGNPIVTYVPRNPSQGGTSASATPTVTDQASYDALPAGAQYLDPSGHMRTKGGGAGNGAGGFPNVPNGNPLSPYGGR